MLLITRIATTTRSLALMISLAITSPALANPGGTGSLDPLDAKHCVRLARDDKAKAQTITNTCSEKIEIVWCHTGSKEKGTHNWACGEDKYFRQHRTLDPGKIEKNRFSLPLDAQIHFGACIGNYYTLMTDGNTGHYTCRPSKAAKTEAEKHEPSFPRSLIKKAIEYETPETEAAKKHLLELDKQCRDDNKSPACAEIERINEKQKGTKTSIGIRG